MIKNNSSVHTKDVADMELTNEIDSLLTSAAKDENLNKQNENMFKAAELNTQIVQSDNP